MELDHLGDDGPKPPLGNGAAAGGTVLFVLFVTSIAYLVSGGSVVAGLATLVALSLLILGVNALYDRYVL